MLVAAYHLSPVHDDDHDDADLTPSWLPRQCQRQSHREDGGEAHEDLQLHNGWGLAERKARTDAASNAAGDECMHDEEAADHSRHQGQQQRRDPQDRTCLSAARNSELNLEALFKLLWRETMV